MGEKKMKQLNILFLMIGLMIAAPILMSFLFTDPILQQVGVVAVMIAAMLWLRTRVKGIASDLMGSKMKWICSACGMPNPKTECSRCGSKQRKLS